MTRARNRNGAYCREVCFLHSPVPFQQRRWPGGIDGRRKNAKLGDVDPDEPYIVRSPGYLLKDTETLAGWLQRRNPKAPLKIPPPLI
jgi:hypothetical protein